MSNSVVIRTKPTQIFKGLIKFDTCIKNRQLLIGTVGYNKRNISTTSQNFYLFDNSSGGSGGLNKLSERERAKENMFIRKLEREQLLHIKEEIQKHKAELAKLEDKINELSNRRNDDNDDAVEKN